MFLIIHVLILYSGCNETFINETIFFLFKIDIAIFLPSSVNIQPSVL